jgi:hypothetical protein
MVYLVRSLVVYVAYLGLKVVTLFLESFALTEQAVLNIDSLFLTLLIKIFHYDS